MEYLLAFLAGGFLCGVAQLLIGRNKLLFHGEVPPCCHEVFYTIPQKHQKSKRNRLDFFDFPRVAIDTGACVWYNQKKATCNYYIYI